MNTLTVSRRCAPILSSPAVALLLLCAVAQAQHAVKGEFKETFHAKPFSGVPTYQPVGSLSGHLRSVGADTMEILVKYWIEDFKKIYPNTSFDMEAKASGTAGPALTNSTADLGPVAREMLPNEEKEFVNKFGYKPFPVRVAGGSYRTPGKTHAIAFFVNEKNPIRELSFEQIEAMYSTTHKLGDKDATRWGDLGVKGDYADKPIHLWGLIRPNGIAYFLQMSILGGGDYKKGITERTTVGSLAALDAIVQGVAKDPYAIGYAGFGNETPGVKTVALAKTSGGSFYKGTFEEVLNQQYPLSRVIYIYVNRAPGQALDPKIREFLKFVLSRQGQDDVVREGIFLPLPTAMVREELEKLNSMSPGPVL